MIPLAPERPSVNISLSTIIKSLLAVLSLVLLYLLRDLVLVLLLSVVIASAVEPAVRWGSRWRLPRALTVLLVYALTIGLFVVLLPTFFVPIILDLSELAATLPARLLDLQTFSGDGNLFGALATRFGASVNLSEFLTGLPAGLLDLPRGFLQIASLVFGGLFSFLLVVVISFYLAVQPNGIVNFLRIVTPISHEKYILDLWQRSQRKIGWWMQGQLLLGLLIGVLVFLGLTILQVKYALLLALAAALFELIPFFGPILSAVPAALLGFSESFTLGLMVIGLYVIIQQFENYLVYPLVVTKMVGVPPLVVILSLIIGFKLAGFLGLILAVPLAAVLMELALDWEKNKMLAARKAAPDVS